MASLTVVLMGVSGSGKSSVLPLLARRLGAVAAEGDAFHSAENVRKMASGRPLTDRDRGPWLRAIAAWIGEQERVEVPAVISCSALRHRYRDILRDGHPSVVFVHLATPRAELERRLLSRSGHYMPASLLDSQLATLEPLGPDERGFEVTSSGDPAALTEQIVGALARTRRDGRDPFA
jgi:gluconokinase